MEHVVHNYVLKNPENGSFFSFHDEYDGYYRFVDFPSDRIWLWDNLSDLHDYVSKNPVLDVCVVCDHTVTVWIGDPI